MLRACVNGLVASFVAVQSGCGNPIDRPWVQRPAPPNAVSSKLAGIASDRELELEAFPEVAKDCSAIQDIKEVEIPIDHDNPRSEKLAYKYQHIKSGSAKATVIMLPGGPGGTMMARRDEADFYKANVGDLDLVLIDPRGIGCNNEIAPKWKLRHLTTKQHASDVVAVMKSLGSSKIIVQGDSYGTAVATTVVAMAEAAGLKPIALLLQGTVGPYAPRNQQAFGKSLDAIVGDDVELRSVVANPPKWLKTTRVEMTSIIKMELNVSPRALKTLLTSIAAQRDADDIEQRRQMIKAWNELKPNGSAADLSELKLNEPAMATKGENNFYAAIGCREIFGKLGIGEWLLSSAGEFAFVAVKSELNICDLARLDVENPYNPKDHQVRAPIYYVQGSLDPSTPLTWANQHFESMTKSVRKEMLEVELGGHGPLVTEDALLPCANKIYDAIARGQSIRGVVGSDGRCKSDELTLWRSSSPSQNRVARKIARRWRKTVTLRGETND